MVRIRRGATLECLRFTKILQNCVPGQVFGRMCSIVFFANLLRLPIQTLLFVAFTRSVFWGATQFQQNEHTPGVPVTATLQPPHVTAMTQLPMPPSHPCAHAACFRSESLFYLYNFSCLNINPLCFIDKVLLPLASEVAKVMFSVVSVLSVHKEGPCPWSRRFAY